MIVANMSSNVDSLGFIVPGLEGAVPHKFVELPLTVVATIAVKGESAIGHVYIYIYIYTYTYRIYIYRERERERYVSVFVRAPRRRQRRRWPKAVRAVPTRPLGGRLPRRPLGGFLLDHAYMYICVHL